MSIQRENAVGFKRKLLDVLLNLSCLLVTTFGVHLYFSENRNINDPIVSPFFWISKDIFFTTILAGLSFKSLRERLDLNLTLVGLLGLLNFLVVLMPLVKIGHLNPSYLRVFKNLFIYGLLFCLGFPKLLEVYGHKKLLEAISNAIFVSLFVSLFFFLIDIVSSIDRRMYGTYGNPTSMGFSAVAGLVMRYALDQKVTAKFLVYCFIASITIYLSGSISPLVGLFIVFPTAYGQIWIIKSLKKESSNDLQRFESDLLILCLFIPVVFIGIVLLIEPFYQSELIKRIFSLAADQSTPFIYRSNSISGRFETLQFLIQELNLRAVFGGISSAEYMRVDSTLIAFLLAFGILAPLAILGVFYVGFKNAHALLLAEQAKDVPKLTLLASFLWIVLVLNLPLQHQIEIFPTNIIIFSFVFILVYFNSPSGLSFSIKSDRKTD